MNRGFLVFLLIASFFFIFVASFSESTEADLFSRGLGDWEIEILVSSSSTGLMEVTFVEGRHYRSISGIGGSEREDFRLFIYNDEPLEVNLDKLYRMTKEEMFFAWAKRNNLNIYSF